MRTYVVVIAILLLVSGSASAGNTRSFWTESAVNGVTTAINVINHGSSNITVTAIFHETHGTALGNATAVLAPNARWSFTTSDITNTTLAGILSSETTGGVLITSSSSTQTFGAYSTVFNIVNTSGFNFTLPNGAVSSAVDTGTTYTLSSPGLVSVPDSSGGNALSYEEGWTTLEHTVNYEGSKSLWALPDGRAIKFTGSNGEIYTVGDDQWTPITQAPIPESDSSCTFHSALLAGGTKVLLITQSDGCTSVATYEYDISLDAWTVAGPLSTARSDTTLIALQNGGALVPGIETSEQYDPASKTWLVTEGLTGMSGQGASMEDYQSALLDDGRVLVACDGTRNLSWIYIPSTGTWTYAHRTNSVLGKGCRLAKMRDGRVLMSGGTVENAQHFYIDTTQIFDPATGTWSQSGWMTQRRANHELVPLSDGSVMAVGGDFADMNRNEGALTYEVLGDKEYLRHVEIFDPATKRWTDAAPIKTGRANPIGVQLADGRVLVAEGTTGAGSGAATSRTVEIYTPPAVSDESGSLGWHESTGSFNHPMSTLTYKIDKLRVWPLADGRALKFTQQNGEYYDPDTDTWASVQTAPIPAGDSTCRFSATLLAGGYKVLLTTDGYSDKWYSCTSKGATYLYDIASDSWTTVGSMNNAITDHQPIALSNGGVLVPQAAYSEEYDPATQSWTLTGGMSSYLPNSKSVLLDSGKVLAFTGGTLDSPDDSVKLYDPATGTWTATGSLNIARSYVGIAKMSDGRVMVSGGMERSYGDTLFTVTAEIYDPTTGAWTLAGSMHAKRALHELVPLSDGKVLAAGGYFYEMVETDTGGYGWGGQALLQGAEIYDPSTDTWTATDSLVRGRLSPAGAELADGTVLLAGGSVSGSAISGYVSTDMMEIHDPF